MHHYKCCMDHLAHCGVGAAAVFAAMQAELAALHGQLLAERKVQAKTQDDLALMATSRDTWRVGAMLVTALPDRPKC